MIAARITTILIAQLRSIPCTTLSRRSPKLVVPGSEPRTSGSPRKDCIKELPIGRFVTHDHMISAFERNKFCPRNPRSKFLTQIEWNAHVATSVQDKCWHVYGLQDASNIKVSIHT